MGDRFWGWFMGSVLAWGVLFLVIIGTLYRPLIAPWSQERMGMANLRQAEQERQIAVEQARAERDSAKLRAEAIKIVGEAAQKFPEYRKQEFIGAFADAMQAGTIGQIIYVPTEGAIPILEAGKRSQ